MTKKQHEKKDVKKEQYLKQETNRVSKRVLPKRSTTVNLKKRGFFNETITEMEGNNKTTQTTNKLELESFPTTKNIYSSLFPKIQIEKEKRIPHYRILSHNESSLLIKLVRIDENDNNNQLEDKAEESEEGLKVKETDTNKEGWFISPELRWNKGTWINCDVRYFDFSILKGVNFEVVLMDPPWRLRGSEVQSIQRSMFTNSKFALNYNTLSDNEIFDLDIKSLSSSGLIFLWVINSQLQLGMDCLKKWGYKYVNRVSYLTKI